MPYNKSKAAADNLQINPRHNGCQDNGGSHHCNAAYDGCDIKLKPGNREGVDHIDTPGGIKV